MTKLTLSVDEGVLKQAKQLAARHNTSVSAMFTEFVRTMARGTAGGEPGGRIARKASGLLRLPKGKSARQVLTEALAEKYGA